MLSASPPTRWPPRLLLRALDRRPLPDRADSGGSGLRTPPAAPSTCPGVGTAAAAATAEAAAWAAAAALADDGVIKAVGGTVPRRGDELRGVGLCRSSMTVVLYVMRRRVLGGGRGAPGVGSARGGGEALTARGGGEGGEPAGAAECGVPACAKNTDVAARTVAAVVAAAEVGAGAAVAATAAAAGVGAGAAVAPIALSVGSAGRLVTMCAGDGGTAADAREARMRARARAMASALALSGAAMRAAAAGDRPTRRGEGLARRE